MGMNAIGCEGSYAKVGEGKFGKGRESASDFSGSGVLKGAALLALVAAGTFAAGCIDDSAPPTKETVKYDKDGDYIMAGKVDREIESGAFPGYDIQFLDRTLVVGQPVVIHRLDKNALVEEAFNVCRVRNEGLGPVGNYILNCGNVKHDGIEVGDFVAAYRAVEIQE